MTGTLRAMHAESVAAFAKMQALAYNPLDLSQQAFIVDYAAYQIAMNSIERRLAGILKTVGQPDSYLCSCAPSLLRALHSGSPSISKPLSNTMWTEILHLCG